MAKPLVSLTRRTIVRLDGMQRSVMRMRPPLAVTDRLSVSLIAIESASLWYSFLRSYFLLSALAAPLSTGTRVVGTCVATSDDALTAVIMARRRHGRRPTRGRWSYRDEPNWRDPKVVYGALALLSLSNASSFVTAMAAGTGAHERIHTYRNFVAHKSEGTALKVRNLVRSQGVRARLDPIELGLLAAPGRPQPLLADWLGELVVLAGRVPC